MESKRGGKDLPSPTGGNVISATGTPCASAAFKSQVELLGGAQMPSRMCPAAPAGAARDGRRAAPTVRCLQICVERDRHDSFQFAGAVAAADRGGARGERDPRIAEFHRQQVRVVGRQLEGQPGVDLVGGKQTVPVSVRLQVAGQGRGPGHEGVTLDGLVFRLHRDGDVVELGHLLRRGIAHSTLAPPRSSKTTATTAAVLTTRRRGVVLRIVLRREEPHPMSRAIVGCPVCGQSRLPPRRSAAPAVLPLRGAC